MKILFATNSYPPNIGGAEEASKRIVDILSKEHKVTVITKPIQSKNKKDDNLIELPSYTIYSFMPELSNYLKENKFDLYITFGFAKHFFEKIGDFCKKNNKPCIAIPSGHFHTNKLKILKIIYDKLIFNKSINNYTKIVALTNLEKKYLGKCMVPSEKITIIPHTIKSDFTKYKATKILDKLKLSKKKYFLYIGRNSKNKRIDLLIKGYNNVKTKIPLVIAGIGTDTDYLKSISSKQVRFIGEIFENEKKDLIKNAFCCIFPSEYEGFGLVIIESTALKTPILVSDIPVFHEVVKDKRVFFKNTPESITKKIKEFIRKPFFPKEVITINQEKAYLDLVRIYEKD